MTRSSALKNGAWRTSVPSLDGAVALRQSRGLTAEEQAPIAAFPARRFEGGGFRDMAERSLVAAGHEVQVYSRINGTVWVIDGKRRSATQAMALVNEIRRAGGLEPLTRDGGGDA